MKKMIILLSLLLINVNNNKIYCDIKGYVKNPGVYEIKENSTIGDVIGLAGGLKKGAYTDNINLSKKVKDEMVIYIFEEDYIKRLESLNNCVCKNIYKYIECPKEIETTTRKESTSNRITSIKTTSKQNFITSNFTTKTTNINESTTKKITTKKIVSTTTGKITTKKIVPSTSVSTTTPILELININTADVETLCTIKGLGEKKAEAIIEYRNEVGLFKSIDEIMNVSGIGEATFEKIKDYITI